MTDHSFCGNQLKIDNIIMYNLKKTRNKIDIADRYKFI